MGPVARRGQLPRAPLNIIALTHLYHLTTIITWCIVLSTMKPTKPKLAALIEPAFTRVTDTLQVRFRLVRYDESLMVREITEGPYNGIRIEGWQTVLGWSMTVAAQYPLSFTLDEILPTVKLLQAARKRQHTELEMTPDERVLDLLRSLKVERVVAVASSDGGFVHRDEKYYVRSLVETDASIWIRRALAGERPVPPEK